MVAPAEGHDFGSLDEIVDNGYCIGCGLCAAIAPTAEITMVESPNGHRRPQPHAAIPPNEEQAILDHCPGINVTGPFPVDSQPANPVWGTEARVATGWATDPRTRRRASTGGVMTAINQHLLETGRAAFVLQVEPDPDDALHSVPVMVRNPVDLMSGAQSRYASCSPLTALGDAIAVGEPFAVSLKPCDVAAVRNLQRTDRRAAELIVFTQTMFCGTVPNTDDSLGLLRRRGVDADGGRDQLVAFRWRGEGCPGPTTATLADGTVVTGTYNELWNDNPWTTQFRCKICPDAVGLQADIATGDTWPGAVPAGESEGTNTIIAHTDLGAEILGECERAGVLTLADASPDVLDETQPHHVLLRQSYTTRVAAATAAGLPHPSFHRLAGAETSSLLDPESHGRIFAGTLTRVRSGQADERTTPDYGTGNRRSVRRQD